MKLSLLLEGTVNEDISEMDINNVCYDPQNCGNGDLLFLLNDRAKNKYITHPKEVAAIVTESPLTCNSGAHMYTTSNIRAALSIACARMYCKDLSKIKFIGITGTNGKSTTAIMLENILADFGIIRYYKAKVLITLIKNSNYLLHTTGNHFHNLCLLALTTLSG